MFKLLLIFILGLCISGAYGGTCYQAYQCQQTCYRTSTYYSKCGIFGWGWARCSKQRTVSYSCAKTCYKSVCCVGYTGIGCQTPICFGSTSCQNGGTCSSPNTCRCSSGFSSPQCNDLNECNTNNGGCEQVCNNNKGSFTCLCRSGYKLNTDGRTCSVLPSNSTDLCVVEENRFVCRKLLDEHGKYMYIAATVAGSVLIVILLAMLIVRPRHLRYIRNDKLWTKTYQKKSKY